VSVAATNWVWTQSKAEGADRLVLLALADFADESGRCFGSWGTMQRKTRLARCTIARSIKRLAAAGELTEVEPAKTVGNRNMATVWQLPVTRCQDETGLNLTLPRSHSDITPGLNLTLPRCQNETPTIVNVKETSKNVKGADAPAPAISSPSLPSLEKAAPKPKKAPKPEADLSTLALPHGSGFREWWIEYMEHRRNPIRGRRAPMTRRAAELILEDLAELNEQQACEALRMAIKKAWIAPVLEPYQQQNAAPLPPVLPPKPKGPSPLERSLAAMRAEYGKEDAA